MQAERVRGKHSSAEGSTTFQGGGQCAEVTPDMLCELPMPLQICLALPIVPIPSMRTAQALLKGAVSGDDCTKLYGNGGERRLFEILRSAQWK